MNNEGNSSEPARDARTFDKATCGCWNWTKTYHNNIAMHFLCMLRQTKKAQSTTQKMI